MGSNVDIEILKRVHDELPVGVWVARASNGEEVYCNARFSEILGVGLLDANAGDYAVPYGIHTRNGELYPEDRMPFVRALQANGPVEVDDIVIHRRDGSRVYVRAYARPLWDADGKPEYVVIAFTDITREVEAQQARDASEARAQHAARMESIGNLAGGIAHDFNNLLAVVRTTAFLVENERDAAQRAKDLALVRDMADRAATLTRSLLSFAGSARERIEPVDVTALVQSLAPILERAVDQRIRVSIEASARRAVLGDAVQLEQVVMNLVLNARDAMPDGGDLSIVVRDAGEHVELIVSDTGAGIPPAIRARIFDPYFTTKAERDYGGAGLGLSTVYGVVQSHGGVVEVADAAGGGARFRVLLPATTEKPARRAAAAADSAPDHRVARPLVLLAEDSEVVRFIMTRALNTLGYEVLPARDGVEALARFEKRRDDLVVALLDVRMPRLDGLEAFRRIRALAPRFPVFFLTGHANEEQHSEIVKMGADGYLAKPVDPLALDLELRRVLSARG